MKRAQACFLEEGLCMNTFPTNKITGKRRRDLAYYIVPDVNAIERWEKFLHEVTGYFVYAIMGYI
jgi:hypothetical protein